MREIRTKAETYYDFEEEDMQQAEVTFGRGGSRWRRAAGGYCFRDGRRVPRSEFDEARGRRYEELGARLAVAALGAVAFLAAHDWATAWRGYEAVGGEFLLLLAPLWAWMVEMLVTDWREGR